MRVNYAGQNASLRAAADYVNSLADNDAFWTEVREASYTHTKLTGARIEELVRRAGIVLEVRLWKPTPFKAFAYRNTVAFADEAHPHVLFYHAKFDGNSVAQMVNTYVHEFIHDVDSHSDGDRITTMGHGNNSADGKERSVPYFVGNLAERSYNESVGLNEPVKGVGGHSSGSLNDGRTFR